MAETGAGSSGSAGGSGGAGNGNGSGSGGLRFTGIRPLQRLAHQARALAYASSLYDLTLGRGSAAGSASLQSVPPDPWPGNSDAGRLLQSGVFTHHGETAEMAAPPWEPAEMSEPWLRWLHGFCWMKDLKAVATDRARRQCRDAISSWIDEYNSWHRFTWRPDVIGRRLTSWVMFYDFYGASAGDAFCCKLADSLTRQGRHLVRSMVADMTAEEALHAVRGLVLAALALGDQPDWLKAGLRRLEGELAQQINPDGSHVSRNPETLFHALCILIDVRAALGAASEPVPSFLQQAIDRAASAVRFFRHGDGRMALFHGATEGSGILCDTALNMSGARVRTVQSMAQAGFERVARGKALLLVDTGCPAGDGETQGCHASPGAFEFSSGKERIIVNCGAHLANAAWKRHMRATAAHSALVVEDRNAFPLERGERQRFKLHTTVKRQEMQGYTVVETGHNGYIPRFGLPALRQLALSAAGDELRGCDTLTGRAGVAFAVRFHLHPSSRVSLIRDGEEALVSTASGRGWRMRVENLPLALEESIYLGDGLTPRRTQQLVVYSQTLEGETAVHWSLCRQA